MFKNRQTAGWLLATKITKVLMPDTAVPLLDTIVVGLPGGGVPVAWEIAKALHVSLTILVSKKISAPSQPELAIGAVSSSGIVVINQELDHLLEKLQPYINEQESLLTEKTKSLEQHWLAAANLPLTCDLHDKQVIIVDDGIATGMTTLAAIRSVKQKEAKKIIVATPVVTADTKERLEKECDFVIAIEVPHRLESVGRFFEDFHQVEDKEVIEILKASAKAVALLVK